MVSCTLPCEKISKVFSGNVLRCNVVRLAQWDEALFGNLAQACGRKSIVLKWLIGAREFAGVLEKLGDGKKRVAVTLTTGRKSVP
jgi:hypothetical protein